MVITINSISLSNQSRNATCRGEQTVCSPYTPQIYIYCGTHESIFLQAESDRLVLWASLSNWKRPGYWRVPYLRSSMKPGGFGFHLQRFGYCSPGRPWSSRAGRGRCWLHRCCKSPSDPRRRCVHWTACWSALALRSLCPYSGRTLGIKAKKTIYFMFTRVIKNKWHLIAYRRSRCRSYRSWRRSESGCWRDSYPVGAR